MYRKTIKITLSAAIGVFVSACQYEQLNRSEFMSDAAGNAIAHNSALQIIDPWPRVAGNNDLWVPAVKYGGKAQEENTEH